MPVRTTISNGDSSNRIDIVVLGDGYTLAELGSTFTIHANSFTNNLFNGSNLTEPFGRYNKFFNTHLIDVTSLESGADDPASGTTKNTALNATYSFDGFTDRLLYIDEGLADIAIATGLSGTGITAEMRVVTVNSVKYGGGGGSYAVYAGGNANALEIAVHEVGHSFGGLADEYGGAAGPYTGAEPTEINVTKDNTGAKWNHWNGFDQPGIGVIGAYEGGRYFDTGIYRPSNTSKMNVLGNPFDVVSREAFILKFYAIVDPLDDYAYKSVVGTIDNPANLWVDTIDDNIIGVEWFVDGLSTLKGPISVTMAQLGISSGQHVIKAKAVDGTAWVKQADRSSLEQEVTWTVNLDGATSSGGGTTGTSSTNDRFTATAGPNSFDGGGGVDTVVLGIASKDATISLSKSGVVTITDRNGTGGADTLTNIEIAQFTDTTIDLTNFVDLTGLNSAQFADLAKVYVAYFNRAADAKGLYFWADKLGEGMSLNEIAEHFASSGEANALYPDASNTQALVTDVYANVLGRTPDSAGFSFWKGHLDAGTQTAATFVLSIIGGAQGTDITYLANKADLGVYFSAIKGMSDVIDAQNVMNIFGDQATSNTAAAKASVDGHYADATVAGGGDNLFELVGIAVDPFTSFIG